MDHETILAAGSLADIRAAYAQKALSVREAVSWYLAGIAASNEAPRSLNAVRTVSPRALDDAAAADRLLAAGGPLPPLFGIPVLLKDNILTADGMTATLGVAALKSFVPRSEATLVARLRRAGAIVLGKTNMTELGDYVSDVMPSCYSGAGGIVRNPRGPEFGRGQGSSVGSAAAIAAGLAPVAIGGESGNSIQAPATHAGVTGYKPSLGRLGRAGVAPLVPSQDTIGPLARSVEDALLVAEVLSGPDPRDGATLIRAIADAPLQRLGLDRVSIGIPRTAMADRPDFDACREALEAVADSLRRGGARIVDPCDLPSAEELQAVRSSVFSTEFKVFFNAFLAEHGSPCGIGSLADLIAWNEAHPETIPYGQSLLLAAQQRGDLDDPVYRADRARDVLLSTTTGIDAALARSQVDVLMAPMAAASKSTGKAGAPAISIPVGSDSQGSPFGVTLYTSVGNDRVLAAVATAVEECVGTGFRAA